jgi:hypothetical protein
VALPLSAETACLCMAQVLHCVVSPLPFVPNHFASILCVDAKLHGRCTQHRPAMPHVCQVVALVSDLQGTVYQRWHPVRL